jgi:uncharacterized protein (TIGR02118 family)
MIKLVFCVRRKEGMGLDEFQRYWRETHGPLVAGNAEALRIRRYVQVHRRETSIDGPARQQRGIESEPYDGAAELWWDSAEDIAAALEADEGRRAAAELLEDERRFIDLPRSALWLGEEHVVVG